ncbi:MAG TPA: cobalamin-independent methionine synthase II family protein [Bryobacteraceae bacterium]|nr:cobalamin-independent methionine synthase II family protein [Bryobacteraceae bacterium]
MKNVPRAEVIGSLLRPAWLKEARVARQQNRISAHEFKRIEDRAVNEAIAQQEAAGVDVITDGELRRTSFLGPLAEFVDGIGMVEGPIEVQRHWRQSASHKGPENPPRMAVTGKLRRRRSLSAEEFTYLRSRASKPIKATLPSPLMMMLLWSPKHSSSAYPDPFVLCQDAAEILREEISELAALGCTYIQIDAPELATLVDANTRSNVYEANGISTSRMLGEGVDLLNRIADVPGVSFGLHMCRGNNAGRWMAEGGYESISKHVFTRAQRYDTILLEYDDWRSGSFEPLADIPPGKRVVLGLVSTKTDELEPVAGLEARIYEAARYIPREQLALSTQCGFASVFTGNPIREETQPAKLKLVAEVAHRLWGESARHA